MQFSNNRSLDKALIVADEWRHQRLCYSSVYMYVWRACVNQTIDNLV